MGFFDFLKTKSAEQKKIEQCEKIRFETTIQERKSIMHDMILMSPHDDSCQDVDPLGIGEFGFDKRNPIPVYGIDNVSAYMDKIRYQYTSENSGLITFNPVVFVRTSESDDSSIGSIKPEVGINASSTKAPNIQGMIDVYNLYSIGNKKLAKIFINSYSLKTSNKVPKGFFHRDDVPVMQDARVVIELLNRKRL
jgi:hypothetical protein